MARRIGLVLTTVLCLAACGGSKRERPAADEAGFPRDLAPIGGVLAGEPFSVAKIVLRDSKGRQRLELYALAKGSACTYQSAFAAGRYLQVAAADGAGRLEVGKVRSSDLITVYRRSGAGTGRHTTRLILDELDTAGKRAKGRLMVSGDDNTDVRGTFEAAYCTEAK